MTAKCLIFVLGTNNWQGGGQFAPGSGILHHGQHVALNQLPGVHCYSLWPSDIQKSPVDRDDYRVYELSHPIPICESVGPQSSKRWHSMSDDEVDGYCNTLRDQCRRYIDYIETKHQQSISLFFAHHCFMNPVILADINAERVASGRSRVPLVVFAHGTALKMYQNEIESLPDFPMKYYTWIRQRQRIFESCDLVDGVFAVSSPQKDVFMSLFPAYPRERVAVTPCGYNQLIFHPLAGMTRHTALENMRQVLYDGFDAATLCADVRRVVAPGAPLTDVDAYDKIVVFCGRFADWKRLDCVLRAARAWESSDYRILTLVVGGGSHAACKQYVDLAYHDLKLTRTFFVGMQGQVELARIFTIADVGVFPSRDEPFGLVFIECMGCGTPVVGAKSGGPLEFVTPEVGVLVDEGDDETIVRGVHEAVLRALHEDWKQHKGPLCREYVLRKYSLTAQAEAMLAFVQCNFTTRQTDVELGA